MKKRVFSVLWVLVLGWQTMPVPAAGAEPLFKRATAPGQLLVKSIEEQELPASIKESMREQSRLFREHKVLPVSDGRLPDFAAMEAEYRARGRPFSRILADKKLSFSPADVDATSLRGHALPEVLVSGVYTGHSWTGLSRMFLHPGLRHVVLEETDLATVGGGAIFTREMINVDVNGAPAMLVSRQSPSMRSETSLGWFSNGILYSLRTPGVDDASREKLLEIARAISR